MVSTHKPTAMILAAGRGTRMGALGEKYPKALLKVNGIPLIQYHIEKLSASGFSRIIINVSHLATQIKQFVADQYCSGPEIIFSEKIFIKGPPIIKTTIKDVTTDKPVLKVRYLKTLRKE